MNKFSLIFLVIFLLSAAAKAQSFDEGMELYEAEQFSDAIEVFERLDDENSALFEGKSHLAMGNYSRAFAALSRLTNSSQGSIRNDAKYTIALAHFGLKNFDKSLEHLYDVIQDSRTPLRNEARQFYGQILNYLSASQRFETLHKLESPAIRFDLVQRSRSYLDPEIYRIMVQELANLTPGQRDKERIRRELPATGELQSLRFRYPSAPDGMVYNIGVILPTFDQNNPDFTIPRNLYFGMLIAADDYNSRNPNQKVNMLFRNSAENTDTTAAAFKDLAFTKRVDAIMGPLFSEPASRLAELSEEYRIPMLAPLANAPDLNQDYNYTFQLNPTLEEHGRRMAQFAVQELRLHNIAIMIEEGAPGRESAIAFRNEAQRLGANITNFIEENFAATGYDISEFTEIFIPDETMEDSQNTVPTQAVYAPFAGQASETMMNLLLNDLEAKRNNLVVLGSEEWGMFSLTDFQHRFFEIYYSQAFSDVADQETLSFFREDYETRFGHEPDHFSKVGYDTATYLFRSLETAGNPEYLTRTLREGSRYNGLALRIDFAGNRVNNHLFINPLSNAARQRTGE